MHLQGIAETLTHLHEQELPEATDALSEDLSLGANPEGPPQYIAETWVYCRRVTRTMSGLRKLQKLYLIAHDRYGDDLLARIQHYLPFEEAKRARALS